MGKRSSAPAKRNNKLSSQQLPSRRASRHDCDQSKTYRHSYSIFFFNSDVALDSAYHPYGYSTIWSDGGGRWGEAKLRSCYCSNFLIKGNDLRTLLADIEGIGSLTRATTYKI